MGTARHKASPILSAAAEEESRLSAGRSRHFSPNCLFPHRLSLFSPSSLSLLPPSARQLFTCFPPPTHHLQLPFPLLTFFFFNETERNRGHRPSLVQMGAIGDFALSCGFCPPPSAILPEWRKPSQQGRRLLQPSPPSILPHPPPARHPACNFPLSLCFSFSNFLNYTWLPLFSQRLSKYPDMHN